MHYVIVFVLIERIFIPRYFKQISPSEMLQAQRYVIMSNISGRFIELVGIGAIMILYCNDVLQYNPQKIANIVALLPLVGILRLFMINFVEKIGKIKTLQYTLVLNCIPLLVLICIPAKDTSFLVFLSCICFYRLSRELGENTVWQPLLRDLTTNADRGKFFAKMRFSFNVFGVFSTAFVTWWVGSQIQEMQYKILLGAVILLNMNKLYWVSLVPEKIDDSKDDDSSGQKSTAKKLWAAVKASPLLRKPLTIQFLIHLSAFPVFLLYLKNVIHLPSNFVSLYVFMTIVGATVTYLVWGKISDLIGFRPMLIGVLILTFIFQPFILLLQPFSDGRAEIGQFGVTEWITFVVLLSDGFIKGGLTAGSGIAMTSIQHHYVKGKDSLYAMNMQSVFNVLFLALLSVFHGWYLENIIIPQGVWHFKDTFITLDYGKVFALLINLPMILLSIFIAKGLVNTRPHYTVIDFFSSIYNQPFQNMKNAKKLFHEDEKQRLETVDWYARSKGPLAVEALVQFLYDPSFDVRNEAIRGLAKTKSITAGEVLLKFLKDPEKRQMWGMVAWALGELEYREAIPTLLERISADLPVRIRALSARALGKLGAKEAVPLLAPVVKERADPSLHVISSFAKAMIDLDAREYAEDLLMLVTVLRDREERYEIIYNLCSWLDISNEWVLKSQSDQTVYSSLENYIQFKSIKWQQQRKEIISAYMSRDQEYALNLLGKKLAEQTNGDNPTILALHNAMKESKQWSPLHVFTYAWLLLTP